MTVEQARQFALGLPDAAEAPHHHMSSFRVRGKIFATVPPDGDHLHVMVDELEARAAAEEFRSFCEVLRWGKRIAGARITLSLAEPKVVTELIDAAYRLKSGLQPSR